MAATSRECQRWLRKLRRRKPPPGSPMRSRPTTVAGALADLSTPAPPPSQRARWSWGTNPRLTQHLGASLVCSGSAPTTGAEGRGWPGEHGLVGQPPALQAHGLVFVTPQPSLPGHCTGGTGWAGLQALIHALDEVELQDRRLHLPCAQRHKAQNRAMPTAVSIARISGECGRRGSAAACATASPRVRAPVAVPPAAGACCPAGRSADGRASCSRLMWNMTHSVPAIA